MIYNTRDKYIGAAYKYYKEYSQFEMEFLLKLVNKDSWVLDIGANIGSMTTVLAKQANYVVAFEPQEHIYYTLCGNIAINNLTNVKAFQRPVSSVSGETVYLPKIDYNKGGNFGGVAINSEGGVVPAITLAIDDLTLPRCDLIKADVEGHEKEVLVGASKTIDSYRPLLFVEGDRASKLEELINYISSIGYKHQMHISPLYNKDNFAGNKKDRFILKGKPLASFNLFCFPVEKPVDIDDPFLVKKPI